MKTTQSQNTFSRVGIDALALPAHFSGAARYICYISQYILQSPRSFAVTLFCKPQHHDLFQPYLREGDRIVTIPLSNRFQQLTFYHRHLHRCIIAEKIDLFFATHYITPLAAAVYKRVTAFHDMGFVLCPHFYPLHKRLYFGHFLAGFAQVADAIITVSQNTACEFQAFFPQHRRKVHVIYPGIDHVPVPLKQEKKSGQDDPFILSVNSFEKRKNIPFVIDVFNLLKGQYALPHRLLLVGQTGNAQREVDRSTRQSPFHSSIEMRRNVSADELQQLYRQSVFFIGASEYEGFGFTAFEAIRSGRPVFLLRNSVYQELLGDHPYLLPQLQAEKWASLIARQWRLGFPDKLLAYNLNHLNWRQSAIQTIRLFEQIMEDKSRDVAGNNP